MLLVVDIRDLFVPAGAAIATLVFLIRRGAAKASLGHAAGGQT